MHRKLTQVRPCCCSSNAPNQRYLRPRSTRRSGGGAGALSWGRLGKGVPPLLPGWRVFVRLWAWPLLGLVGLVSVGVVPSWQPPLLACLYAAHCLCFRPLHACRGRCLLNVSECWWAPRLVPCWFGGWARWVVVCVLLAGWCRGVWLVCFPLCRLLRERYVTQQWGRRVPPAPVLTGGIAARCKCCSAAVLWAGVACVHAEEGSRAHGGPVGGRLSGPPASRPLCCKGAGVLAQHGVNL